MKLRKLIENTIDEYLNEEKKSENKLNINFKKWFSGSKIVENGKPMICYHGSKNKGINVFDIKKIGQNTGNEGHYGYGIYFSTDIREAKIYGSEIYKCYINIKKPFIGNNKEILKLKRKGVDNIDELEILSIDFNSFKNSFINDNLKYKPKNKITLRFIHKKLQIT